MVTNDGRTRKEDGRKVSTILEEKKGGNREKKNQEGLQAEINTGHNKDVG